MMARPLEFECIDKIYQCIGCGVCAAACPRDAIKMEYAVEHYMPVRDASKCDGCGLCVSVCPGASVDVDRMASELWPEGKRDPLLGTVRAAFIGHSADEGIRFRAASGGIVTTLILDMMRRRDISGAVLSGMSPEEPLKSVSFVARTEEEVLSAATSKYCPTAPAAILSELKGAVEKGKIAFVGLPCQVHGVRKLQREERWARERIFPVIGIFCSHGLTFGGICPALERFASGCGGVRKVRFRGGGWPGGLNVKYDDGQTVDVPLGDYWPVMYAPYFFTPRRCLSCHDMAAELAEISVGDAWLPEIIEKDDVGSSVVIVRSRDGERAVTAASETGALCMERVDPALVSRSQEGPLGRKKTGVGARLKLMRFLGKPVPEYGREFKTGSAGYGGAVMALVNSAVSATRLGAFMLMKLPVGVLKKYSAFVLKYSGR